MTSCYVRFRLRGRHHHGSICQAAPTNRVKVRFGRSYRPTRVSRLSSVENVGYPPCRRRGPLPRFLPYLVCVSMLLRLRRPPPSPSRSLPHTPHFLRHLVLPLCSTRPCFVSTPSPLRRPRRPNNVRANVRPCGVRLHAVSSGSCHIVRVLDEVIPVALQTKAIT